MTRADLATLAPGEEQRATKIYKHPDYETALLPLMMRGKTSQWITAWLERRYPVEDADGMDHPDAIKNAEMRLTVRALDRYRAKYMPETTNAVEGVIDSELESLIGHRLPAPVGVPWELDVLETLGIQAAQVNLRRAMKADTEMDMLQPITLDAQKQLVDILERSVSLKSKLGQAGYEAAPDRQHIVTQNEHFSVEVTGRLDPNTGEPLPVDTSKLDLARALLAASPEERGQIIAAMAAAPAPTPAPEHVDATVVED